MEKVSCFSLSNDNYSSLLTGYSIVFVLCVLKAIDSYLGIILIDNIKSSNVQNTKPVTTANVLDFVLQVLKSYKY